MSICIPKTASTWEIVASIQIAQGARLGARSDQSVAMEFIAAAGFPVHKDIDTVLNYDRAYRVIDSVGDVPYSMVLAGESDVVAEISEPQFPNVGTKEGRYILLCPHALHKDVELPIPVWRAVTRHLRSYDLPVYLMGGEGEWMDACGFAENEILTELPVVDKLAYLRSAELIVGVPNAWLWSATTWEKKIAFFYPEYLAQNKWWGFPSQNYGRIVYDPRKIAISVFLAGLRQMVNVL